MIKNQKIKRYSATEDAAYMILLEMLHEDEAPAAVTVM